MSTKEEAKAKLSAGLKQIEEICAAYDQGRKAEGLKLAEPLQAIFHNSPKAVGLLRELHASGTHLVSTCAKKRDDVSHWSGLIRIDLDPQNSIFRGFAKLDSMKREHRDVPASYWWETEVILTNGQQKRTKRSSLVLAAVEQLAGSESPDKLPESQRRLVDGSGWQMDLKPATGPSRIVVVYEAHLAALRQIAYEVLNSSELLKLAE